MANSALLGTLSALLLALAAAPVARAGDGGVQVAPPSVGRSAQESQSWTSTSYPRTSWHPGDPATTDLRAVGQPMAPPAWVAVTCDPFPICGNPCKARYEPPCAAPCEAPICDPCPRTLAIGGFGRYSYLQPTGTTYITKGGEPGTATTADLERDLDTEDGSAWEVGLGVRYLRHRFHLSYERMSFEGDAILSEPLVFHAETYPQGEHVTSTLVLQYLKGGYDYAFVDSPRLTVRAGASAWWWDFDQRMKGVDSGIDSERSFGHVWPMLDLVGDGRAGWFHYGASVSAGGVGSDRYIVDLEAKVGVVLGCTLSIDVGWRWMRFQFHETTNLADMTFQGPTLSITAIF